MLASAAIVTTILANFVVFLPVADFFKEASFGGGTLPPARRASDSPIAIACLRLVTFLPELPLFNVPAFSSSIAFSTFSDAFLPYLLAIAIRLNFPIRGIIFCRKI